MQSMMKPTQIMMSIADLQNFEQKPTPLPGFVKMGRGNVDKEIICRVGEYLFHAGLVFIAECSYGGKRLTIV